MMVSLPNILLATAGILVLISAVQPLARRLMLSDTVLLAAVGILIGVGAAFLLHTPTTKALDAAAATLLDFPVDSEVFLLVFLPLLVFHGAAGIDLRNLARDATPVLAMAVVAVVVTTAVVGLALLPIAGVSLPACLLLGAIVATTDPSAVIGIFRDIGADSRLTRLVESESLLNDAAAIALFATLLPMLTHQAEPGLGHVALSFATSFAGGILVGFGLARAMLAAIHLLDGIRVAEFTLTLALPYLAYVLCDAVLGFSGVIAAAAAGLTVGAFGPSTFRPQSWSFIRGVWAQLAFLATSLVFVLASMLVPRLLLGMRHWDLVLIGAAVAAAILARAVVLFGLLPALRGLKLAHRIPIRFKVTMLWGGLRGAVTLALALSVTENPAIPGPVQRFVAITATGFVLFTLLAGGTTLPLLVKVLRLNRLSPVDQALRDQVVAIGLAEVRDKLRDISVEFGFSRPAAGLVLDAYARRIKAEAAANTFDTAISDRDRVRLGLISFASQERAILLDIFRDRGISRRIMEALLRAADAMVDGARVDGRLGYIRAARRRLQPTPRFRAAQFLHRRFRFDALLMHCMMERSEMLLVLRLVSAAMERHMRRRMEPVLGKRVAEVVAEIVSRREDLLDDAVEALRVHYPGYAEALETRMLRQAGLRLESEEYSNLHTESLVGEELYQELVRDLEARWDQASRPLRFNLQLGLDARIREIPLFAGLKEAVLHNLAMSVTMRFTVPREVIFRQGRRARRVYFIASGGVRLQDGEREVLLGRGEVFGEEAGEKSGRHRFRATAARFSHLLELEAAEFRHLLAENPELVAQIEALAARARPAAPGTAPEPPQLGVEASLARLTAPAPDREPARSP